jgi:hypothetical protein
MKWLTSMCACVLMGMTTVVLAGAGCRKAQDDAFRGGVPTREAVVLHLPGAPDDGGGTTSATTTTTGSTTAVHSALLGQQADTYTITRDVTAIVNGGTWAVLTLVRTIVDYPATTVGTDSAVWGPYTDALSANTWRLTVTRTQPHEYTWLLEARGKTESNAAFRTIISGDHTAAVDANDDPIEGFGNGTFKIDWDAAATLPTHDTNVGKAAFTYSRLTPTSVVTVDVDFTGIQDQTTKQIFDAVYRYTSTPGQGGSLDYAEDKDNYPTPIGTGPTKEHFTIDSRWNQDGAGRCDLVDSGGDLMTTVAHGSECWDASFASVYRNLEYPDMTGNWGVETACTAFPTASYSSL